MGEFVYIHFRIKRRCIKHAVHQSIKIREIIMRHASLNRIYRLIWSHIHQTWVIVSERTRGKGKSVNRKLLAATLLATSQLVLAGPMDGQVTAGTGVISQQSNTTTVTQSSQNMSLTWGSFNTAGNEIVNFVQPSASAIAVNRIFDTNATQFFGQLNANGQVYLINPNGVVFGAGSQINVGGLVASTLDINDAALSSTTRNFTGTGTGSIINHGSINTVNGGYVAFLGNRVSNQGNINAPQGTVALGAGNDVTLSFSGDSLVTLQINQSTLDNLAENGALIKADGGAVWMSAGAKDTVLASVVNNTGIIQARSAQNVNGVIVLEAGSAGTANNSGTLNASGISTGETGGTVKVLGDTVNLAAGSTIDVSGDAGGGTTLIGGNFLGTGPEHNAQTTIVAAGASINANAITTGTGGSVAVWSDGKTQFDGSITARGGSTAGNGGQVETSGKQLLIGSTAEVNTSAASGTSGTWLLDPEDVVIGNLSYWGNTYGITVDSLVLTRALNQGNVVIKTTNGVASCSNITCSGNSNQNGDITILDIIGMVSDANNGATVAQWDANNYTLTLSAYRDINFVHTIYPDGKYSNGGINIGGHVILKADNAATGTGTVNFTDPGVNFLIMDNANSTASIYYNAGPSYSPTNYSQYVQSINGATNGQLNAYMAINVNGATASKTYDGNTVATLSGQPVSSTAPNGLTIDSTNATATFADKNVGTNKTVTINGIAVTGNGATTSIKTNTDGTTSTIIDFQGNAYYLNGLTNDTGTITKADLLLSGTKTYDGSTSIAGNTLTATGVNGETFSITGSGDATNLFNKDVQSSSVLNSVTGLALGTSSNGGLSSNYNVISTIGSAYTVTAKGITLTGITASDKVYDATTSATLNTSNVGYSGLVNGDNVTLSGSGVGTFDTKDVGTGKTVTVRGYTLSGTDAGNYVVSQPTGLTATITKADLVVSGISASDKTYDATTAVSITGTASVTALLSDMVSLTGIGAGTFNDANAEVNKTVTVTGYSLTGRDANNYNLVQPNSVTATINKADLTLNGTRVYDGSTIIAGNTLTATGVNGETFSVTGSGDATNLSSKNVQTNSQLNSVTGLALGTSGNGGLSSNYNAISTTGSAYTVTAKGITLTGITASDKTYDATTSATLNTTNVGYSGMITDDVVTLSGSGTGTFDTKDVGTGKTVTVRGYTLSGADAGNYVISQPTGLTATITKADLVVNGISASDKTYDATTAVSINGTASVTALLSDMVSLTGTGSGTFNDANAEVNKTVTVTGYSLTGRDANNYNLVQPNSVTATINKADLTLSGTKVYDGSTSIAGSTLTATGVNGETFSIIGSGDVTNLSNKDVQSSSVLNSVTGLALGTSGNGGLSSNYNILSTTGSSYTVTPKGITLTGITASDKVYDATTSATLDTTNVDYSGMITGDVVTLSGSGVGTFDTKDVGTGKTVTVSGYTLSGTDAGNYVVSQPTGLTANVSKANLLLTGLTASDKVYDATTTAMLGGTASLTAAIGSDAVSLSGSGKGDFDTKNVGNNKNVIVSGYTLSGTDANNYNIIVDNSSLTANITPASITISGITANDKTFDGTTSASINTDDVIFSGKIGTDQITLSSTGTFTDAGAGQHKTVQLSNVYGGADAQNYIFTDQLTTTASITGSAAPSNDMQQAITQLQTSILPPHISTQPQFLTASSTVEVNNGQDNLRHIVPSSVFVPVGFGVSAPSLNIQNGGVQLPPMATNIQE
jgi:filamentous hemagglutinin family protein